MEYNRSGFIRNRTGSIGMECNRSGSIRNRTGSTGLGLEMDCNRYWVSVTCSYPSLPACYILPFSDCGGGGNMEAEVAGEEAMGLMGWELMV